VVVRGPEEPNIRLVLVNQLGDVRLPNRVQHPGRTADQIRMQAVMPGHDSLSGMRPGEPIFEPIPLILMNPDRLVWANFPVPGPGVPDVPVVVHSPPGDRLRP